MALTSSNVSKNSIESSEEWTLQHRCTTHVMDQVSGRQFQVLISLPLWYSIRRGLLTTLSFVTFDNNNNNNNNNNNTNNNINNNNNINSTNDSLNNNKSINLWHKQIGNKHCK